MVGLEDLRVEQPCENCGGYWEGFADPGRLECRSHLVVRRPATPEDLVSVLVSLGAERREIDSWTREMWFSADKYPDGAVVLVWPLSGVPTEGET